MKDAYHTHKWRALGLTNVVFLVSLDSDTKSIVSFRNLVIINSFILSTRYKAVGGSKVLRYAIGPRHKSIRPTFAFGLKELSWYLVIGLGLATDDQHG
ncbi:UNVERIFIED_CONTAM: hypothetical protein NCL1_13350 [Trichonephila clavipes]